MAYAISKKAGAIRLPPECLLRNQGSVTRKTPLTLEPSCTLFNPDPYRQMFLHQLEANKGTKKDFTERIFEMSTSLSSLDKSSDFYYLDQFTGFPKKLLAIFQVEILRTIS